MATNSGNYAFGLNGRQVSTNDFNPQEQNDAVMRWASMVQRYLRGAAVLLTQGKEGTITRPGRTERKLEDSIRTQNRKTYGVITGQSFIFERHGVFVHKGVGRGYKIQGGMVQRTAKVESPSTRQTLSRNDRKREREPYEWFNPVIQQSLPELANELANINADAAVNATRMLIR